MGQLDLQQLERLLFVLVGLVAVIVIALIAYLILAGRRVRAQSASRGLDGESVIRPSLQVVGQLLSLVRDQAGGPLQVEIDGIRYGSIADVQDPQVKRQIVAAVMELIRFTGVLGQDAIAPAPLGKTETWREDLRQGSQAELERAHAPAVGEATRPPAPSEVEEQFLNILAELGQTPPKPERPGVVSAVRQRLAPKSVEPEQPRTFVDEIEDIVQRRIQLIPALVGRGLHVRSGPAGKVLFLFEGQEYEGVDDVPNLTARQLIMDAIREWDETA